MKISKRVLLLVLSLASLIPSMSCRAAVDMFLKLDGITGEADNPAHQGEIQIESFSWGVSQTGAFSSGGGGGAGKVSIQDFHFFKYIDSSTPDLFLACLSGRAIPKATFSIRQQADNAFDYFTVVLTNVHITGMNQNGTATDADGSPLDNIALNFTKIEWTYTPKTAEGTAGTPVKGGWDLKANKKL
jgi:type VI secretion system secreted protein Hcp